MASAERHVEIVIDPDQRGPAVARRFVARVLAAWGIDRSVDVEIATLLASEVVTNAVLHGAGPVRIVVGRRPDGVRVEVQDAGNGHPEVSTRGEESQGGRGLVLVDSLAAGWGVRPEPDEGKVVWFDVPPQDGREDRVRSGVESG